MAYTTINKHTDYFNTVTYTGNGTTDRTVTGVGHQPDFTIIKNRVNTFGSRFFDAIRGATKELTSNTTNAEATNTEGLKSFNSDGFTLGNHGGTNENNSGMVSWNWKANGTGSANTDGSINSTVSVNTTAGFSIVSYTGNGTAGATIGHGLGNVPKMIIIKQYSSNGGTENWGVYHNSIGNGKYLFLNLNNSEATSTGYWNNTTPTSSVFTLGNNDVVNNNTVSYIAYCFAEKTGYSKFGSYIGNNNEDGSFVYTGFKPAFVMVKITDTQTDNWAMYDNKRNPFNLDTSQRLRANSTQAEQNAAGDLDFLSNGFKIHGTDGEINGSGSTYIYMAFAEAPLVGSNNVPCTAR